MALSSKFLWIVNMNTEAAEISFSKHALAMDATGHAVQTIESLSEGDKVHPLVQNFVHCDAMQCGFCTPGMVMAAVGLLNENPKPTEAEVREGLEGNLCRCTGYHNIVKAVLAASGQAVKA